MAFINKHDTNGTKGLLAKGELGYDDYTAGGDTGRVYVGTGTENISLAKKSEVTVVDSKADTHIARVDNPHSVTKTQVGLSNVDNTSDANKPVSTAQQTALNLKANLASPVFTGNVTGLGVATGTSFNSITGLSSVVGATSGTAAVGTSTTVARADHVHPIQTTITGNAGTATALQTGRTIGMTGDVTWTSASFNGSANVTGTSTLTNVGTAGTYRSVTTDAQGRVTSGTNPTTLSGYGITDSQPTLVSGTSIKTINGASVLGSGNIVIPAGPTGPQGPVGPKGDTGIGLSPFLAGSKLEIQSLSEVSTESTSMVKLKEVSIGGGGTVTVSFNLRSAQYKTTAYGAIFVNGTQVGTLRSTNSTTDITYTENINVNAGDYIQVYGYKSGTFPAYLNNFKVTVTVPKTSNAIL